jgi:hypothetical protein
MITPNELLTIKEASDWASGYIGKDVTPSNNAYLVQYGLINLLIKNYFVYDS